MKKYAIASFETYAREPILRRMKDGSLVCTFLTGGPYEPHNDNVIAISRSEDDGVTWSKPETLFSHDNRGCWCTEIFTDCETPFTRIIEHKHFENRGTAHTVITREYPMEWHKGAEPYYPINNERNTSLYAKYRALADAETKYIFGGRLADYKYYDMHQVIEIAMAISLN